MQSQSYLSILSQLNSDLFPEDTTGDTLQEVDLEAFFESA